MEKRSAQITRKTGETDITMNFCLDGSGKAQLSTGIGFFDHMDRPLKRRSATRRESRDTAASSCRWMRR